MDIYSPALCPDPNPGAVSVPAISIPTLNSPLDCRVCLKCRSKIKQFAYRTTIYYCTMMFRAIVNMVEIYANDI